MTVLDEVLTVNKADELFAGLNDTDAEHKYRKLQREVHPDMWQEEIDKDRATIAFIYLNELWESFNGETAEKNSNPNIIQTHRHTYIIKKSWWEADGFSIQKTEYEGPNQYAYLVFPKIATDNDLNLNAAQKIKLLNEDVNNKYKAFYPVLMESFKFDINGKQTQCHTINIPENLYTLREALAENPTGLNGRDVAWIYKRLLVAMGNAHELGLVHGGINLDSILIEPDQHGLLLTNWQYAVEIGERLKAYPKSSRAYYPEYVFQKQPLTADLDIALASRTMLKLGGDVLPKPMQIFFKACTGTNNPPAAQLLAEFNTLLERVYGEPKFHKFEMKHKKN